MPTWPVPLPDHSFYEEILLNVQPEPPLMQFEAISSHPIADNWDMRPTPASLQPPFRELKRAIRCSLSPNLNKLSSDSMTQWQINDRCVGDVLLNVMGQIMHGQIPAAWALLLGTALCWGSLSTVFKPRMICLYMEGYGYLYGILLTKRHALLWWVLALEYTQLSTFVLIKFVLKLLTLVLVQICNILDEFMDLFQIYQCNRQSSAHIVCVEVLFFLFNRNKWKLLEQRDIWSQAELLGLDFITNLNLRPVLIGFVNVFSKRGPNFKQGWTQLWGNLGQGMVLSGKHMKLSAFSWFRVLLWSTWSIQT